MDPISETRLGLQPHVAAHTALNAPIGRIDDASFSWYAGAMRFDQLPISRNTRDGLREAGRGDDRCPEGFSAAYALREGYSWRGENWVGKDSGLCYSGKHHYFSAGLLIGGCKDVDMEKERVNEMNMLVFTPGRLLQHMDETPNFECSQLQVLVLDEADHILDVGFKKTVNAIVSQLPKNRQTFLFSATQTKSVQDLARLSLKDPEYLSVHEESETATANHLQQTAMVVPLDQKLDMLWSFIKAHLN